MKRVANMLMLLTLWGPGKSAPAEGTPVRERSAQVTVTDEYERARGPETDADNEATGVGPGRRYEGKLVRMRPNHPNPASSFNTISFSLLKSGTVAVGLYNHRGRLIGTVLEAHCLAGEYRVRLGTAALAAGHYYYRLRHGKDEYFQRLLITK